MTLITERTEPTVSPHLYWSALLTTIFLIGLVLVGKHNPWGWALGILDELLWVVYAVISGQWPFIVSAVIYAAVCLRNLRTWRRTASGANTDDGR